MQIPKKTKKPFAKKSLGQNFLIDQNYIKKIISALNLKPDETVIEIGAGRGALTSFLVESGANVVAIEIDRNLIPLLKKEFGSYENFQLIEQDALEIDYSTVSVQQTTVRIKLVANLPYYISTAILQRLIEFREVFSEMVLMLQKEVVERITAEAGHRERGFLTVLIEAYFESEKLFDVPPNAFRPAPKVKSSVMRLITKKVNRKVTDEVFFRKLISESFRQKRKTLLNNLKNLKELSGEKNIGEILEKAQINPKNRAEDLTLDEWLNLADLLLDAV